MLCPSCKTVNPDGATACSSCASPLTVAPPTASLPGAIPGVGVPFAGRYQLLSILGKGGMGVVYRAKDLELDQEIAIKLLMSQFTSDPEEVARFKREVVTARAITHPNVVRIHDFGVTPASAPGAPGEAFLSMELLPGGTLADRIAKKPSIAEATSMAIAICDGLAAAHARGVIHRDLKPHNVLFDAEEVAKISDFGIARLADSTRVTQGYAGTPHYMSPEQATSKEITTKSDLYSLGVVLYELFTGTLPFKGDSLVSLALMHANDAPRAPRTVRADIPAPVEALILRALAKSPDARPASAAEMASVLRGELSLALPAATRRRWVAPGVAVSVVLVGVIALAINMRGVTPATPTPSSTPTLLAASSTVPAVSPPATPRSTPSASLTKATAHPSHAVAAPSPTPEPARTSIGSEPYTFVMPESWKEVERGPNRVELAPGDEQGHVLVNHVRNGSEDEVTARLTSPWTGTKAFRFTPEGRIIALSGAAFPARMVEGSAASKRTRPGFYCDIALSPGSGVIWVHGNWPAKSASLKAQMEAIARSVREKK